MPSSRTTPSRASSGAAASSHCRNGMRGWLSSIRRTPAARAARKSTSASAQVRCPEARTRSWAATTSSTSCHAGSSAPSSPTTSTRRKDSVRCTDSSGAADEATCAGADTVGIHTTRPPSRAATSTASGLRSEEHTSELQSRQYIECRLLLEKKNKHSYHTHPAHNTGNRNSKNKDNTTTRA